MIRFFFKIMEILAPWLSIISASRSLFKTWPQLQHSVPRAIDPLYGHEFNPSIVFSSAQANVAAICYFIALAFSSGTTDFGLILLGDPLQSMDDINVLGLSDFFRFLRREKQLIIATHEDRLSNSLLRKLTSRGEPLQTPEIDF
jgi:hypothetical protein